MKLELSKEWFELHVKDEDEVDISAGQWPKNPMFLPLKTEYYNAFKDGSKSEELRLYGKRYNEKTCQPGRYVLLSKGYGKQNRMLGIISSFKRQRADTFGSVYKASIMDVYGNLDKEIACFSIKDLVEIKGEDNAG